MIRIKMEDTKEEKVKDIVVELKNMEDRIVRLTPNSSNLSSAIISKDGEKLYYLSAFEGGFDHLETGPQEKRIPSCSTR